MQNVLLHRYVSCSKVFRTERMSQILYLGPLLMDGLASNRPWPRGVRWLVPFYLAPQEGAQTVAHEASCPCRQLPAFIFPTIAPYILTTPDADGTI